MSTIYERLNRKEKMEEEVIFLKNRKGIDYLDAIILYAEKNDIEIESINSRISTKLKKLLEEECLKKRRIKPSETTETFIMDDEVFS